MTADVFKPGVKSSVRHLYILLVALWVLVVISALMVVYSVYETRNRFNDLEILRRQQEQLQVEWSQYLLEESAWASYGRVEKLAIEKLGMKIPSANDIIVVKNDG